MVKRAFTRVIRLFLFLVLALMRADGNRGWFALWHSCGPAQLHDPSSWNWPLAAMAASERAQLRICWSKGLPFSASGEM